VRACVRACSVVGIPQDGASIANVGRVEVLLAVLLLADQNTDDSGARVLDLVLLNLVVGLDERTRKGSGNVLGVGLQLGEQVLSSAGGNGGGRRT